jgi:hypothetical protein
MEATKNKYSICYSVNFEDSAMVSKIMGLFFEMTSERCITIQMAYNSIEQYIIEKGVKMPISYPTVLLYFNTPPVKINITTIRRIERFFSEYEAKFGNFLELKDVPLKPRKRHAYPEGRERSVRGKYKKRNGGEYRHD